MNSLKILLVFVLSIKQNNSAGHRHRLIYQKDISEHCRRRVVPSTFLGRQVVEANARILQFSRLELPYSCLISIRTESGSNMVMMIQLEASELKRSCSKNGEQLLVYEMGETFGGYWGPLPDTVMKREPSQPQLYTLKTTQPTTTTTETSPPEDDSEEENTDQSSTASRKRSRYKSGKNSGDYIEVEVPLLNFSVHFVPGKGQPTEASDFEDAFDVRNDVTPIPGVSYDRNILPLVQFHLEPSGGRRSGDDDVPRYELDIVQEFTPDMRLTLPIFNPTAKRKNLDPKHRYQATRRLNFKKHRTLLDPQRHLDRRPMSQAFTNKNNDATKYKFPTTIKTITTKDTVKYTHDSWQVIKDLIQKLDKTKENAEDAAKTTLSIDDAILLEKISNMNHNLSVYLSSNLTKYNSNDATELKQIFTTANNDIYSAWKPIIKENIYNNESPITERQEDMTSTIIDYIKAYHGLNTESTENTKPTTESRYAKETRSDLNPFGSNTSKTESDDPTEKDDDIVNTSVKNLSVFDMETAITKESKKEGSIDSRIKCFSNKIVTGSMVGHESWENVVQAAPEMAVLLNQAIASDITRGNTNDVTTKELYQTTPNNKLLKRKKRDIHAISIENARPYKLTTKKEVITTTMSSFEVGDMQEFAQLVELQDDELHGRIALRYLRQYVGPALFNLCELADSTQQHVHLFNSSRIVLAVTNFTLERMIVILTAARTLLTGETRCPLSQLECQVAGARVCLDSMVACDGVPNCGSYDIYDEDRLMCGHSVGLQHNVYLAAFTFLAVLLTLLYAVHYWLKRCVPQVADAFFVYTAGVENVLYLDTIMRSPNDTDDMSKMVYHSHLYGDINIYDDLDTAKSDKNACQRFLQKCCLCFRKKHRKDREEREICEPRFSQSMSKRTYSFTELEIRKMISASRDTAVQTGDSLEMKFLENTKNKNVRQSTSMPEPRSETSSYDFPIMIRDSLLTLEEPLPEEHKDELSLLKFFNDARTDSIGSVINKSKIDKKDIQELKLDVSSEKEIRSHAYDQHGQVQAGPSQKRKKSKEKIEPSSSVSKHLRFDEVATTIPSEEYDDEDDEEGNVSLDRRRSVALGESRPLRGARHLDTIEEADEHSGGGKEHRHFWGSSKGKKSKKKTQVSLR